MKQQQLIKEKQIGNWCNQLRRDKKLEKADPVSFEMLVYWLAEKQTEKQTTADISYSDVHALGKAITKHQFEIFNPLRKIVVALPDIVAEFDAAGVDIVPKVNF